VEGAVVKTSYRSNEAYCAKGTRVTPRWPLGQGQGCGRTQGSRARSHEVTGLQTCSAWQPENLLLGRPVKKVQELGGAGSWCCPCSG
jgi:hypothetical protein